MAIQMVQVTATPDGRMNRKNAAKYMGYSEHTLARLACIGGGPKFVKRGRVWYFKEDLDAWFCEGKASTAAAARLAASKEDDSRARQGQTYAGQALAAETGM